MSRFSADLLVRFYVQAVASKKVDKVFWWTLRDGGDRQFDQADMVGDNGISMKGLIDALSRRARTLQPSWTVDVPPFRLFGLSNEPALLLGTDILETFRRVSLDFRARRVRFQLRRCTTEGVVISTSPPLSLRMVSSTRPASLNRTLSVTTTQLPRNLARSAFSPPLAVGVDALSFAASAIFMHGIDSPEPQPEPGAGSGGVMAGLRFIARNPIMRASLGATATINPTSVPQKKPAPLKRHQ